MKYIDGYKTHATVVAIVLAQLLPLFGLKVDPEVIQAISVGFGVLAVVFNKLGRDKLKKAVDK